MQTQEIPREQWNRFFDSFSQQHQGWLATLELFSPELGAQEEAHELPFEGISLSAESAQTESIVISLAQTTREHVSHKIDQPRHVWLLQTPKGADASLEIEADDSAKTLLSFRSPVRPEFIDDVM